MTISLRSSFAAAAAALALVGGPSSAHAAVKVLACEPEWAALVQELGGPLVDVQSATTALQDPHRIQARPSLLARARQAELLACTGAELEAGWLPVLLQQSGNPRIQPGQPGHFMAADLVTKLGVPAAADRSQGDVHAAGNPHIQTDPRRIATVATGLAARLRQVDPANAAEYSRREADFARRWGEAQARWQVQAAPLKGLPVAVQHASFAYLQDWLGLKEVAVLEPKPGVEPSAAHLQSVLGTLKATPAKAVLYAAYQDPRPSEWLSREARIPAVKLPFTVGGTEGAGTLFTLFDDTVARLKAAAAP
jgi:zinc/manganese transport system substrate-binding protein